MVPRTGQGQRGEVTGRLARTVKGWKTPEVGEEWVFGGGRLVGARGTKKRDSKQEERGQSGDDSWIPNERPQRNMVYQE